MSYEQAPYWLWPLDRWKLLLTLALALLLILFGAIKQPALKAVNTPIIQNPASGQKFIEGEPVTISGTADAEQVVHISLCPIDLTGLPTCDETSVHALLETRSDASGVWQVVAPPQAPGELAVVAATIPDESGQTRTSPAILFQTLPATPTVISPSFDSPTREDSLAQPLQLTGQAGPGNAVFLFANAEFLGQTFADAKGLWRFEAPELDVGTHLLVAKALASDGEALAVSEPLIILIVPES